MNNLSAECIEQNDAKEKVLHLVRGDVDGTKYKIQFSASCPVQAIEIARFVPIAYWEKEWNILLTVCLTLRCILF